MRAPSSLAAVSALAALTACAGAAVSVAACFPDYGFADAGSGQDAGQDGPTSMNDAPVSTGDGAPDSTTDGAVSPDAGADGTSGSDADAAGTKDSGAPGFDASNDSPAPTMVTIDGGTYAFQVDLDSGVVNASATLTYTLAIDPYEVTIGRFAGWVGAGMPLPEAGTALDPNGPYSAMTWDDKDFNTPAASLSYASTSTCGQAGSAPVVTYTASNLASHPGFPVTCVTWAQALAFCWWDGHKRLPTDTEWRIVATSGGTRSPYSWGSPPATSCSYATADLPADPGHFCGFPVPVGSATQGMTVNGVYDITGSLQEWLWDEVPTSYTYPSGSATNYAGPSGSSTDTRVYVGGSWSSDNDGELQVTQAGPSTGNPTEGFDSCGFRCAQSRP